MAKIDVNVPDIGDFKDVPVIEVLVKPGDVVKAEQSLVTLESDKATMDVPSPIAGAVAEVVAKIGDKVSMGTLIARIDTGAGESAGAAAPAKSAPAPAKAAPAAPAKSAAAPASPKTATIDITVPDIGDFKDVPVIEVLVKTGDTVEAEQPLVTLESDKATMDVPSPAAGKIIQLIAKVGDKVSMGALIAKLDAGGPAAPVPPSQENEAQAKEEEDAARAPETSPVAPRDLPPALSPGSGPAKADFSGVFAGPAVRRLARELDLDLNTLKGTGEKGRITREDVKAALSRGGAGGAPAGGGALPAIPAVDFAKFGPIETVAAVADQAHLRPAPARILGQCSACDALRRGRHHRPRRFPQDARRGGEERQNKALPRVPAAAAPARHGRDAEGVPDFQRRAKSSRRLADIAALLAHRRRRRHPRRTRGRGDQGR